MSSQNILLSQWMVITSQSASSSRRSVPSCTMTWHRENEYRYLGGLVDIYFNVESPGIRPLIKCPRVFVNFHQLREVSFYQPSSRDWFCCSPISQDTLEYSRSDPENSRSRKFTTEMRPILATLIDRLINWLMKWWNDSNFNRRTKFESRTRPCRASTVSIQILETLEVEQDFLTDSIRNESLIRNKVLISWYWFPI
jgi:hypothetical protein